MFTPVETAKSDGTTKLETPTAADQALFGQYDTAPYSSTDGAIPFLYFGGKYISVGATFDASILQGKSLSDIASALSDTSSPISQGAIGAANGITAAICGITDNKPAAVCGSSAIKQIQSSLQ